MTPFKRLVQGVHMFRFELLEIWISLVYGLMISDPYWNRLDIEIVTLCLRHSFHGFHSGGMLVSMTICHLLLDVASHLFCRLRCMGPIR